MDQYGDTRWERLIDTDWSSNFGIYGYSNSQNDGYWGGSREENYAKNFSYVTSTCQQKVSRVYWDQLRSVQGRRRNVGGSWGTWFVPQRRPFFPRRHIGFQSFSGTLSFLAGHSVVRICYVLEMAGNWRTETEKSTAWYGILPAYRDQLSRWVEAGLSKRKHNLSRRLSKVFQEAGEMGGYKAISTRVPELWIHNDLFWVPSLGWCTTATPTGRKTARCAVPHVWTAFTTDTIAKSRR